MVAMDGSNVGIKIQDQNDNAPEFDQAEYQMIFPPTSSAVSLVGRVTARDRDGPGQNSNLEYRLRESSEYFSIDSSSGEIISKKRLLHLKTTKSRLPSQESLENVYMLSVIVSDHGKPPLTDECLLKILEESDGEGHRGQRPERPDRVQPGGRAVQRVLHHRPGQRGDQALLILTATLMFSTWSTYGSMRRKSGQKKCIT